MQYKPSRDVASEEFDGDSIVLDLSSGKYYSFSNSGSLIWQALSTGVDSDTVLALGKDQAWKDAFHGLIAELVADKLLFPCAERGEGAPDELRKRLAEADEMPSLTVFDDLVDLFLADPIHDVESELGWPVKKEA
jgi:hypothetical protein